MEMLHQDMFISITLCPDTCKLTVPEVQVIVTYMYLVCANRIT